MKGYLSKIKTEILKEKIETKCRCLWTFHTKYILLTTQYCHGGISGEKRKDRSLFHCIPVPALLVQGNSDLWYTQPGPFIGIKVSCFINYTFCPHNPPSVTYHISEPLLPWQHFLHGVSWFLCNQWRGTAEGHSTPSSCLHTGIILWPLDKGRCKHPCMFLRDLS